MIFHFFGKSDLYKGIFKNPVSLSYRRLNVNETGV